MIYLFLLIMKPMNTSLIHLKILLNISIVMWMNFLPATELLAQEEIPCIPMIDGEFWRIGEAPNLDSLNGKDPERQDVVDHGFIKDIKGKWHLWACIRGTKVGRLLYGWEGKSLEGGGLWEQTGIKARAEISWGEKVKPQEQIQAPYFSKIGDTYYCFYNSAGIRVMISKDGANYSRIKIKNGSNVIYQQGGRDVMIMEDEGIYYAYSTISTVAKDDWLRGFTIVRTSKNLINWSDYTIVSEGGRAGNGVVSAESPFVQKYKGYYYLFRSSSSTGTVFVYRSKDPYNFGVNNDEKLIAELPVWAPELILENGQWYISDIADFKGVKLAKIKWKAE